MAVTHRPWALLFGATSVAFVQDTLSIPSDDDDEEDAIAGGATLPYGIVVQKKRPRLSFTLTDPTQLSAWEAVGSAETITSLKAVYRKLDDNAGFGSTYKSFASAQGVLVPKTLTFEEARAVKLAVDYFPLFDSGVAWVIGTDSASAPDADETYVVASVVLGGTTYTKVVSGTISWEYAKADEGELEVAGYFYDKYRRTGEITIRDLSAASIANLEDGTAQTLVVNLVDRQTPANTVQYDLGTPYVRTSIENGQLKIRFGEVSAS